MEQHDIEIEIAKDGQVKVHIRGVKGKQCLGYVEFLSKIVGPVAESRLTQEYYEPDGRTRVDAEDVQEVSDAEE